jgi:hypothetical protein
MSQTSVSWLLHALTHAGVRPTLEGSCCHAWVLYNTRHNSPNHVYCSANIHTCALCNGVTSSLETTLSCLWTLRNTVMLLERNKSNLIVHQKQGCFLHTCPLPLAASTCSSSWCGGKGGGSQTGKAGASLLFNMDIKLLFKSETVTTVTIKMFIHLTLAYIYRRFGGMLPPSSGQVEILWTWRQNVLPKCPQTLPDYTVSRPRRNYLNMKAERSCETSANITRLHGVTSQKTLVSLSHSLRLLRCWRLHLCVTSHKGWPSLQYQTNL